MKKNINRIIALTAIFVMLFSTTVFAKVYTDPYSGFITAQVNKKTENMTVKGVPAGIPYVIENNTDVALAVLVNGVPSGALAPRTIDPAGQYYVLDCAYVDHPLGTIDTIKVKNGVVNITQ